MTTPIFLIAVPCAGQPGVWRRLTTDSEAEADRVMGQGKDSIRTARKHRDRLSNLAWGLCEMDMIPGPQRGTAANQLRLHNVPHYNVTTLEVVTDKYRNDTYLAAFMADAEAALQVKRDAKGEYESRLQQLHVAIDAVGGVSLYAVAEGNGLECHTHLTVEITACYLVLEEQASGRVLLRVGDEYAGDEGDEDEDEEEKTATFNAAVARMTRKLLQYMLPPLPPPAPSSSSSSSSSSSFLVQPSSRGADGMEKVFCGWVTRIKGQAPPLQGNIPMGARFKGVGERIRRIQEDSVPFSAAACDISRSRARMNIKARTSAAGQVILQHNRDNPGCPFTLKSLPVDDLPVLTQERIAQARLGQVPFPVLVQTRTQALINKRTGAWGIALAKTQDVVESLIDSNWTTAQPFTPTREDVQALLNP